MVPYLAIAASEALKILQEQPQMLDTLRANAKTLFTKLGSVPGMLPVTRL